MIFSIETSELQRIIKLLGVTSKLNVQDITGRILIESNESGTISFISNNNSTAISVESISAVVSEPGEVSILYGDIKSFVMSFLPWNETHGVKEFLFSKTKDGVSIDVDNIYENGKISKGHLKLNHFNTFNIPKPKPFGEATCILNSNIFKKATSKTHKK
jgi:hypothetical protein